MKEDRCGCAVIADINLRTILSCSPSRPPPPYSFGQCGTVQPLSRIRSNQMRCGRDENLVLRPPQKVSASDVIGRRISGGQLASSQARVSRRKFSRSDMGVSIWQAAVDRPAIGWCCWPDLSGHTAKFNISLTLPMRERMWPYPPDPVYSARPQGLKNKRKPRCA